MAELIPKSILSPYERIGIVHFVPKYYFTEDYLLAFILITYYRVLNSKIICLFLREILI